MGETGTFRIPTKVSPGNATRRRMFYGCAWKRSQLKTVEKNAKARERHLLHRTESQRPWKKPRRQFLTAAVWVIFLSSTSFQRYSTCWHMSRTPEIRNSEHLPDSCHYLMLKPCCVIAFIFPLWPYAPRMLICKANCTKDKGCSKTKIRK